MLQVRIGAHLITQNDKSKREVEAAFSEHIAAIRSSTFATCSDVVEQITRVFNSTWGSQQPFDPTSVKPRPPHVDTAAATLAEIAQLPMYMRDLYRMIPQSTIIEIAMRQYTMHLQTMRVTDDNSPKETHPDATKTFCMTVTRVGGGEMTINIEEQATIDAQVPTDPSEVGDITIPGKYSITATAQTVLDLVWQDAVHFKEIRLNGREGPTVTTTHIKIIPGGLAEKKTNARWRSSGCTAGIVECTARCALAMLRKSPQETMCITDCTRSDLEYITAGVQFCKLKKIGLPGIAINHIPDELWRAIKANRKISRFEFVHTVCSQH